MYIYIYTYFVFPPPPPSGGRLKPISPEMLPAGARTRSSGIRDNHNNNNNNNHNTTTTTNNNNKKNNNNNAFVCRSSGVGIYLWVGALLVIICYNWVALSEVHKEGHTTTGRRVEAWGFSLTEGACALSSYALTCVALRSEMDRYIYI